GVTDVGYPGTHHDDSNTISAQPGATSVACTSSSTAVCTCRQVARTDVGMPKYQRSRKRRCEDRFATTPPPERARSYIQPRCGPATWDITIEETARAGAPTTPAASSWRATAKLGQNASVYPHPTGCGEAFASSTSALAASSDCARGFSTNTAAPASRQRRVIARCESGGVHTHTASTGTPAHSASSVDDTGTRKPIPRSRRAAPC